jgi:uncharacterized protein (TIGR03435 family)
MRVWLNLALVLCCHALGQAQEKPKFDAATIKPFTRNANGRTYSLRTDGGPGTPDPGRIKYTNLTLKSLVTTAYGLKSYQVIGPSWIDTDAGRFVIEAVIHPGATKEQVNEMLQNLLIERFLMEAHREVQERPLYELVLAQNGPKLKDPGSERPAQVPGIAWLTGKDGFLWFPIGTAGAIGIKTDGGFRIIGGGQTLSNLADTLSDHASRPVIEKSGSLVRYDYNLDFATDLGPATALGGPSDAAADLVGAVSRQLGIRMEPKVGPIEMLVIDHLNKAPTEN